MFAGAEVELPAVPRATQYAPFATVVVLIHGRGQRGAGDLPDAHRRAGVGADVAVGEELAVDVEHAELDFSDGDELASTRRDLTDFGDRMSFHRFQDAAASDATGAVRP